MACEGVPWTKPYLHNSKWDLWHLSCLETDTGLFSCLKGQPKPMHPVDSVLRVSLMSGQSWRVIRPRGTRASPRHHRLSLAWMTVITFYLVSPSDQTFAWNSTSYLGDLPGLESVVPMIPKRFGFLRKAVTSQLPVCSANGTTHRLAQRSRAGRSGRSSCSIQAGH